MSVKKILIVSRSFYPTNSPRSFRTTELAKELSRQGHDVTVITPKDEQIHNAFAQDHGLRIKDMGATRWKSISTKGQGPFALVRRALARALNLFVLYPEIEYSFLVKRAVSKARGYDLLVSIAAPHSVHWGVAWAWSRKRPIAQTWVADCGDPFMGGENDSFKRPFYFKYIEKWFCTKAHYITVPTEESKSAYYPEFLPKLRVIPQGFNFEEVALPRVIHKNPVPTFAYAGTIIPGIRDPKEFFETICNTDRDLKFYIYTNKADYLEQYAGRSNGRIILKQPIPRTSLLKELASMDFLVNFENRGSRQSPSKLIDYAIVGKPILSVSSQTFDKASFLEFLDGNYSQALKIEDVDRYKIQNVARQFLNLAS